MGTDLHEGPRRCHQLVNGRPWDHENAGAGDDPSQDIGPHGVHVFLVCQRFVANQPIDYDELKMQQTV